MEEFEPFADALLLDSGQGIQALKLDNKWYVNGGKGYLIPVGGKEEADIRAEEIKKEKEKWTKSQ